MDESPYLKIAARMFGKGDPGLLNADLVEELNETENLLRFTGGSLRSRQIIAIIIRQWIKNNPNKKPCL